PPSSLTVNPGSLATFSVVASGTAPLTYQWRKDGAALVGGTGSSYTIASVGTLSAGSYDVVVGNMVNSSTSTAAVLLVNTPVSIVTPPSSLTVNPGSLATFSVVEWDGAVDLPVAQGRGGDCRWNGLELHDCKCGNAECGELRRGGGQHGEQQHVECGNACGKCDCRTVFSHRASGLSHDSGNCGDPCA
ncbi:MAG: hypothetical protein WCL08_06950, partial [Verrucomicrobiota bacterium]